MNIVVVFVVGVVVVLHHYPFLASTTFVLVITLLFVVLFCFVSSFLCSFLRGLFRLKKQKAEKRRVEWRLSFVLFYSVMLTSFCWPCFVLFVFKKLNEKYLFSPRQHTNAHTFKNVLQ